MFPVLISSIIIILAIAVLRKKNTEQQDEVIRQFWEREREANETRRVDLNELSYITIPLEYFPLGLDTESEKALVALADTRMINLHNMSNTELKLEYGAANLEALTEYESNFVKLQQTIEVYATELEEAGRMEDAITVLEFAVSVGSDTPKIFTQLGSLYQAQGEDDSIRHLIDIASKLDSLSKEPLVQKLKAMLPEDENTNENFTL